MAQLNEVPRTEWRQFFDRISKALPGKWAEIEVAALDLGDQVEVEWIPLLGISYDPYNDRVDVVLDRINHAILHPQQIVVEEAQNGVSSVAVVDADGERQVVHLKDPLTLRGADVPSGTAH